MPIHGAAAAFLIAACAPDPVTARCSPAWPCTPPPVSSSAPRVHAHLADGARAAHAYLEAEALYGRTLDLLSGSAIAAELDARRGRALMRYRLAATRTRSTTIAGPASCAVSSAIATPRSTCFSTRPPRSTG